MCIRLAILLSVSLALLPQANAAVISDRNFGPMSDGGAISINPRWILETGQSSGAPEIFQSLFISHADVGSTFTITALDGSSFDAFVQLITNGNIDTMNLMYVESPPFHQIVDRGTIEPNFFFGDISGGRGIDLAGYNVDSISERIDSWDAGFLQVSLVINGSAIPEPCGAALVGTGFAIMLAYRKKRNPVVG
jgi:hypothetical protein